MRPDVIADQRFESRCGLDHGSLGLHDSDCQNKQHHDRIGRGTSRESSCSILQPRTVHLMEELVQQAWGDAPKLSFLSSKRVHTNAVNSCNSHLSRLDDPSTA